MKNKSKRAVEDELMQPKHEEIVQGDPKMNSKNELNELIKKEYGAFIANAREIEVTSEQCGRLYSNFLEKHNDAITASTFFILLIEIIQESKGSLKEQIEQLEGMIGYCDRALRTLWHDGERAKGRERYRELLENEDIQDYSEYTSCANDREYQLLNTWEKRVHSLAEAYWDGDINRDDLAKKVDTWNKRKCEKQREIEISYVMWKIANNYKHYSFPIECEYLKRSDVFGHSYRGW